MSFSSRLRCFQKQILKPAGKLISIFAQSLYLLIELDWEGDDAKTGETLQIGLGLFLPEIYFILKWAPPCWRAVPPSWLLLMVLLSPKEAVMLGKPICFNITQPSCL